MTRRAKLRAVFQAVVEQGGTAQTLLDDIEEFTASGNSGIENWLNRGYTRFVEKPKTAAKAKADCIDNSAKAADLLKQAAVLLGG